MPSVLVETGFLTNSREGAYLNSKRGQTEMSRAIAKAIMKYKSSLDGTLFTGLVMDTLPVETTSSSAAATTFRIQIAASTKKMALKPYNFKGLSDISRIKTGSLYTYCYGSFSSYKFSPYSMFEIFPLYFVTFVVKIMQIFTLLSSVCLETPILQMRGH